MTPAFESILPKVLPAGWRIIEKRGDGVRYLADGARLSIIASVEQHGGASWVHVSCSRLRSLPSWDDLKLVKDVVIGRDRKAIQVLPPASEYVNVNPTCLHLYHCLDGDMLPDFTQGTGSL